MIAQRGTLVRFRDVSPFDGFSESMLETAAGFSITKVNSASYTFVATSGTATSGNVAGGGGICVGGSRNCERVTWLLHSQP